MIGGWQRWSLSEPPCGLGLTSLSRLFGACTHGYTGSCSCVSRTSVARAASARTASCCCMSSTSLARGHIPRRSLKSTQSLGAAGAGCGWHHRRAGARVWLRGTRAGMHAKKGGRNKKMAAETGNRTRAATVRAARTRRRRTLPSSASDTMAVASDIVSAAFFGFLRFCVFGAPSPAAAAAATGTARCVAAASSCWSAYPLPRGPAFWV